MKLKKVIASMVIATVASIGLLLYSLDAFAAMWSLVNSQFTGGNWYCTYELQGSSPKIQTTIVSQTYCQSFIFAN